MRGFAGPAALAGLCLIASPAEAKDQAIDIPAGTLGQAIAVLGVQARVSIVVAVNDPGLLRRPVGAVRGTMGAGRALSAEEVRSALALVMDGEAPDPLLAALLTGLKIKGETPEELIGAVRAIRDRMTPFPVDRPSVLDTCGTGGDGANSLNISTAAAIVVSRVHVPTAGS